MVIGDTTFNSENWEETVDPHRTYNGWACIRYGIGETLVRYTDSMELEPWLAKSWENDGDWTWTIRSAGQCYLLQRPEDGCGGGEAVPGAPAGKPRPCPPATPRSPICRRRARP